MVCDCHLCSANTQVSEEGSALPHLISSLGNPLSTLLLTGCQRHSGFVMWPCATGLVTLPEHLSLIGLTAAGPYVIAAISLPPLPGGWGAAGQRQQRLGPASPRAPTGAVLAACSSYFRAMFTADMKEKSKSQIRLPELSHAVLEALVNYAYTSQIQITKRNVQSLLQAADLLQFVSVKRACEQFLVRHLDADNCLGMHAFAEHHNCLELEKESRRMLLWQFEEVWKQDEFLDVSKEKLAFILSRENLNVWKEEAAVGAVVRWVAHNVEERIEDIYELLSCIKLDLDNVYLRSALSLQKKCRLNDNKIRSLVYSALNPSPKGLSKRPTAAMYVVGGYYWHPLSEVHVWDPLTNAWLPGAEMPDHTRESYGVTSLGPDIYVTGGYRTESIEALDTMWIYNSERDEWAEGCPMLDARYYHCAVSLSGCIYALGGYRKGAPVQEAEFYDPLKKKWVPIANMIKEYGLCSITLQNKIYFVGGQTTITDCYDPEQDEWKQMAHMLERRMECGAVVMNGCIYVTGGYSYSKGTYLQSIEKYNPELNTWEAVGNLPSAMRSHGCVCVLTMITVFEI
uniref:Kelch like family member 23 n=1 Tax=Pavo cristatus TaxID=9049 RepID=A0A8C9F0H8_PAVCR